jgi:tRNA(Ile)-lysidine synthase
MPHVTECAVQEHARRGARLADAPLLLAVSGGLDSMTLLHAMTTVARERIAAVATFDHATGEAATLAVAHVAAECARVDVPFLSATIAPGGDGSDGLEALWRRERHRFLRASADRLGARVVTAHTRDDQIETVLMRVLRGSGARGLAALEAPGDVLRPFVAVSRAEVERYAERHRVSWIDDPSNASRRFLRNRVRHDLLPALRRVDPAIDDSLLETGRSAAAWRRELDASIDAGLSLRRTGRASVVVAAAELAGYDRHSLAVLWGAIAGRVGLALDGSGTRRCAAFTMKRPHTGEIPLSGGWRLEARGGELVLRRANGPLNGPAALPSRGRLEWGCFRFTASTAGSGDGGWAATLPEDGVAQVRCWQAGDRLSAAGGQPARRVKRYLSDAGLRGSEREGWPVVTVGDEVVWIPGVRRSDAATVRSGGPARHYLCERTHD